MQAESNSSTKTQFFNNKVPAPNSSQKVSKLQSRQSIQEVPSHVDYFVNNSSFLDKCNFNLNVHKVDKFVRKY